MLVNIHNRQLRKNAESSIISNYKTKIQFYHLISLFSQISAKALRDLLFKFNRVGWSGRIHQMNLSRDVKFL